MPKFNTPETRAELLQFAMSVEDECSIPEVGFTREGIMQHVKDFFCEQRRYATKKKELNKKKHSLLYSLKIRSKHQGSNREVQYMGHKFWDQG